MTALREYLAHFLHKIFYITFAYNEKRQLHIIAVDKHSLSLADINSFKRFMINCNDTITNPDATIPTNCRSTEYVLDNNAVRLCITRQAHPQPSVASGYSNATRL